MTEPSASIVPPMWLLYAAIVAEYEEALYFHRDSVLLPRDERYKAYERFLVATIESYKEQIKQERADQASGD